MIKYFRKSNEWEKEGDKDMSKRQITVMIVGYGDRGHAYTKYA